MKVLVGCEFSGIVRDAFLERGHDAISCDLKLSKRPGPHYRGDVRNIINDGWDLAIFHPPCTHLAVSGARWFYKKQKEQKQALEFVRELMNADIPKIAIENPVSIISTRIRKPDQVVQPYMFGDPHTKTTCLWLKNLPLLQPTKMVDKGKRHITKSGRSLPEWYNLPPSEDRAEIRSKTFGGFAQAMADQWGECEKHLTQLSLECYV